MEIDDHIFKTERGKNASFFVGSHLIDGNKDIVSDAFSTGNNTVSPLQQENLSSPVTVKSPEAFTDRTYSGLETNTSKFSKVKTPAKARCDCFPKQLNSQRHDESLTDLFLQDGIIFLREELVSKQNTIDKLLQVLSVDSKNIKRDGHKISHKSCQINLLPEKCNSNDKTMFIKI